MGYEVRKRKQGKWWVIDRATQQAVDGPHDSKEAAQEALNRLQGG